METRSNWFVVDIPSEFFSPMQKTSCERCACVEDRSELTSEIFAQCNSCGHPQSH